MIRKPTPVTFTGLLRQNPMKYKVSVIITSFNHADTLRASIESVLCQITGYSFEVVIVDDGSTDNSLEVLEDYWDMDNVLILPQRHRGLMKTYQRALELCTGEYIMFSDCDDYWVSPHKIQWQVEYMDDNPSVGLSVSKVYVESAGERSLMCKSAEQLQAGLTFDKMLR
jgi:cellulose synthase/poly-beta-1,6-N-acetylglucosamine synthase-like glycosyltransferase